MDAKMLKRRIQSAKDIIKIRNISGRTKDLYNLWKHKCETVLKVCPKKKAKIVEDITVIDGALKSRVDAMHAEDGLVQMLVDSYDIFLEARIKMQYEDYWAYSCKRHKGQYINEAIGKKSNRDCIETAEKLADDDAKIGTLPTRSFTNPVQDDIDKAAAQIGSCPKLMKHQILTYADRN